MQKIVRIGSRASALALAQTNWVKERLERACPECQYVIVEIKTKGDEILDRPLAMIGGKGLFIKEIEYALLRDTIDMAVHSLKDMPAQLPEGLQIGAVSAREDPRDVLITPEGVALAAIPRGGRIGTSSLRRKAQLLAMRPDLAVVPLRGNINTRLRKMTEDRLDGIILAAAGLARMGWIAQVSQFFDPAVFIPAIGQGALAIETRSADPWINQIVTHLDDCETRDAVTAERGVLERLEGSCQVPVGAYAQCAGTMLGLSGFIGNLTGSRIIRKTVQGEREKAFQLGVQLAENILRDGGEEIMCEIKRELGEQGMVENCVTLSN